MNHIFMFSNYDMLSRYVPIFRPYFEKYGCINFNSDVLGQLQV